VRRHFVDKDRASGFTDAILCAEGGRRIDEVADKESGAVRSRRRIGDGSAVDWLNCPSLLNNCLSACRRRAWHGRARYTHAASQPALRGESGSAS
jgi:hypothetical protein